MCGKSSKSKLSRSTSSGASSISTAEIKSIIECLRLEGARDSTRKNYYIVWRSFSTFFLQLDFKPTSWEDRVTLFVAYLIQKKQAKSQTVRSYISAMRSVLRDDNIELSEDKVLLSALTRACKMKNDVIRTRLPIQKNMLIELLKNTKNY